MRRKRTRTIAMLMAVLMITTMIPADVTKAAEPPINVTPISADVFPDKTFRDYVTATYDSNSDGYFQAKELEDATTMDISKKEIKDLTGIRFFKYLKELDASDNQLKSLDLNKSTELLTVDVSKNQLTQVELGKCTKITQVNVSDNQLEELDIASDDLTDLNISNNRFIYQDVSSYVKLENLNVANNLLEKLKVVTNTALLSLDVSKNDLDELDISKNVALESLACGDNRLASLDVSACTSLNTLYTENNKLPYIKTYNNGSAITTRGLGNQNVQATPISNGASERKVVMGFPDNACVKSVSSNEDSDIAYNQATGEFTFSPILSGFTYTYMVKSADALDETKMTVKVDLQGVAVNKTNFPDEAFRNYVITQINDGSGYLTVDEINGAKDITLVDAGVKNLTGLEYFTSLERLNVSGNALTGLSIASTKLKTLDCSRNNLTNVVISNNLALEDINCSDNDIKAVNVAKHIKLKKLNVSGNSLTAIDVKTNSLLESLNVSDNQLNVIDVRVNTALKELDISNNNIAALNVVAQTQLKDLSCDGNSLPYIIPYNNGNALTGTVELGTQKVGGIPVGVQGGRYLDMVPSAYISLARIATSDTDNVILDQAGYEGKFYFTKLLSGFTYEYTLNGNDMTVEVDITEVAVNEDNFPDENFRTYVAEELDTDGNGYLNKNELKAEIIEATDLGINDLTGVEKFPKLKSLNISKNNLESLDISNNTELESLNADSNSLTEQSLLGLAAIKTKLKELYLEDNQFNALDIEENTELVTLNVAGNKLLFIDIMMNKELLELNIRGNDITTVDIGKNTKLTYLDVSQNNLITLDVNKNTKLTQLYASDNKIENMDVRKNTLLEKLSLAKNELTALDIQKQIGLKQLDISNNQLETIDVSKNVLLEQLYCESNKLRALDISTLTELAALKCSDNRLESLELETCSGLTTLECSNNQITTLDLTVCTELAILECEGNQLPYLMGVSASVTSPLLGEQNATGTASAKDGEEGVWEIKLDLPATLWDTVDNLGTGVSFDDSTGYFSVIAELPNFTYSVTINDSVMIVHFTARVLELNEASFPDANFLTYVKENLDTDQNGYLNEEEMQAVTTIMVAELDIADLTGIENFQNLITLDCSFNELTTLDVSSNTKLENLYCKKNQILNLDLSKNIAINKLYCNDNELATLNISACSSLGFLACENNSLTSLELAQSKALTYLNCSNNQLQALDVSKQKQLTNINCADNTLTALDIQKNNLLINLNISGNELDIINLSNNTSLEMLNVSNNQFVDLNVTANTNLTVLNVSNNQFEQLDVTINTNLLELNGADNKMQTLDLSQNTKLVELNVNNNKFENIDIAMLTKLKHLFVHGNGLNSLNVSDNTELMRLDCSDNELTQLDLTNNEMLEECNSNGNHLKSIALNDGIAPGNKNIFFGIQQVTGTLVRNSEETAWEIILGIDQADRSQISVIADEGEEEGIYNTQSDAVTFHRVNETFTYQAAVNGYEMKVVVTNTNYEQRLSDVDSLDITPSTNVSVIKGQTESFMAVVNGINYPDQKVSWSISEEKSIETYITTQGELKVGTDETAPTITVTATSVEDSSKSTQVTVTIKEAPATVDNVTISSTISGKKIDSFHLEKGKTQVLYATVFGTNQPSQSVTWSITGNQNAGTVINSNGVLTLSLLETATKVMVTATSNVDSTKKVTINVITMNAPPSKGKTLTVGKGQYTIITAALTLEDKYTIGTVAYTKNLKVKESIVIVPDTIKVDGIVYHVTEIKASVFKNNKKLKKVTIGSHVTKIGKKALYGCKKLQRLKVSSQKLTSKSVGSKAFKGIKKKVFVITTSKVMKSYKKIFKKAGITPTAIYRTR